MKRNNVRVPKALRDVQKWKQALHDEVKDLPLDQALREIARAAKDVAAEYGFAYGRLRKMPVRVAAEGRAAYGARARNVRGLASGHGHGER